MFLDFFVVDEVKNFAAKKSSSSRCVSHELGAVQKGGVHILKSSEVLKR